MILSLLDRNGLRHEIDSEMWVSMCLAWVVTEMDKDGDGHAELRIEAPLDIPVYALGSPRVHYVAGITSVSVDKLPFGRSCEHITCLKCIGGLR